MIILRDKQNLYEMSRLVVSDPSDGLPFRVAINSVENATDSIPHAHILDKATGKTELGTFKLPQSMPRNPDEIESYIVGKHKLGVSDDQRQVLFKWFSQANKAAAQVGARVSNLQSLQIEWLRVTVK